MPRTLTVACIQNNASADHEANIEAALRMSREAVARGAELICLPEYFSGFGSKDGLLDLPAFPEAHHAALSAFRAEAKRQRRWFHLGSIAVKLTDGRIANRGFVLDPDGAILARYDKIHLFDVDLGPGKIYRESATIAPGNEAVVADTPWGGLGLSICYDLRFAALYRALAHGGAVMLTCPAAFTRTTGEAHWHVLNRARAIEHGAFMIAPCQYGTFPGGGEAYGHSLIVDPWGTVLADGGAGEAVVTAAIDLDAVAEARRKIPALRHDRSFRHEAARTAAE
jgi:predicted amidohydrolase